MRAEELLTRLRAHFNTVEFHRALVTDDTVNIVIATSIDDACRQQITQKVKTLCNQAHHVQFVFDAGLAHVSASSRLPNVALLGSCKGGVGKSTLTCALAYACAARGIKVGIIDADIYNPSVPAILKCPTAQITANAASQITPASIDGIAVMSFAFWVEHDNAVLWSAHSAVALLEQFTTQTDWSSQKLLLVDLPPATGDIPIAIIRMLQNATKLGGIVVTNNDPIAIQGARRFSSMLKGLGVNSLGYIHSMYDTKCDISTQFQHKCLARVKQYRNTSSASSISKQLNIEIDFLVNYFNLTLN